MANPKPTELAITLAALRRHRYVTDQWLYASQISANLKLLGFDVPPRGLGSALARMCRADAPWLERRKVTYRDYEYRVTQWGRADIQNRLPGVKT